MSEEPLRVAIDAQLPAGTGMGGVETMVLALVRALGRLDGPEQFVILAHPDHPDWLTPHLGPNQRLVVASKPQQRRDPIDAVKRAFGPLRPALRALRERALMVPKPSRWPELPLSDGTYEALGCHVLHLPWQKFVVCSLPTVFNPHDLQHRHYPGLFTPAVLAKREVVQGGGCRMATVVAAASQWVKQDIVRQYGVHPGRVRVVPWASPTEAHAAPSPESLAAVRARYDLEPGFALYPAMGWPHKNHVRLLQAIAQLRDRGAARVRLVCTGAGIASHRPRIEAELDRLALREQVRFLGLVPATDLRALYALAKLVVIPTLFEAASGPLFEGWLEARPVACASVTSLPEQAGDGALLFDPLSVDAIAHALERLDRDGELRADLVRKGTARLQAFSWERTARAYRALYRLAARRPLDDGDRGLLEWDWMAGRAQPLELW